eukprot:Awhi_evm1s1240
MVKHLATLLTTLHCFGTSSLASFCDREFTLNTEAYPNFKNVFSIEEHLNKDDPVSVATQLGAWPIYGLDGEGGRGDMVEEWHREGNSTVAVECNTQDCITYVETNPSGACRINDGQKGGIEGTDYDLVDIVSAEDCRHECDIDIKCLGYEVYEKDQHCEKWLSLPDYGSGHVRYDCFIKQTASSTRRRSTNLKNLFDR